MAEKIKTAVIGVGYLGRFHAQKYASIEETELIGVVDFNLDRAKEVGEEVGADAFDSFDSIIDKVDAVSIVTPTETHHKVAREFLSRGKHVLLEKPMTVTMEEAEDLIKLSAENNAVLQVGHLERFNPAVVALQGVVDKPVFIESHRLSPFPNRATDVDVVLDLMIHDIDIILNLVDSDIDSIEATGVPVISGKVDIANARLKFKNGCVANVTASRVSSEPQRKIRLFQLDAYMSIDYAAQQISVVRLEKSAQGPKINEEKIHIERGDSLLEEIKSFVACIKSGETPLVSGTIGKRALGAVHKIQKEVDASMELLKSHGIGA